MFGWTWTIVLISRITGGPFESAPISGSVVTLTSSSVLGRLLISLFFILAIVVSGLLSAPIEPTDKQLMVEP